MLNVWRKPPEKLKSCDDQGKALEMCRRFVEV
jgi:hypothetical protein